MLNDRTRNILVGLTMLAVLAGFLYGVDILGRLPHFTEGEPYVINLRADNAGGLLYGDRVNMNGVFIGKVEKVVLSKHMHGAIVRLHIHGNISVPANTLAYIGQTTIGAPYVTFSVPPGAPAAPVAKNGSAVLVARQAPNSLIPQGVVSDISTLRAHFTVLSDKLSKVATDLHTLLRPQRLAAAGHGGTGPAGDKANISALIQRLNRTTHSINAVVGNPKMQAQARDLVANLDRASKRIAKVLAEVRGTIKSAHRAIASFGADAKNVGATVTGIHTRIARLTDRLGTVLKNLSQATRAIARGKGTAGKLINDPRLYNGLVDLSNRLKSTVNDLHVLVRKIQKKGFQLNIHL